MMMLQCCETNELILGLVGGPVPSGGVDWILFLICFGATATAS